MRTRTRRVVAVVVSALVVAGVASACVNDDPQATARPPLPEAGVADGPDPTTTGDGQAKNDSAAIEDDGGARCDPKKPFGTPVRVNELSGDVQNEWTFRASDNELLGIFTRQHATQILMKTTRETRSSMWGTPIEITGGPWGTFAGDPQIATVNGKRTLFFTENNGSGWNVKRVLWDDAKLAPSAAAPSSLALTAPQNNDVGPVFVEATNELWFLRDLGGGALRIHRTAVLSPGVDGPFDAPAIDGVLGSATDYERNGALAFSADGNTVYFGGWPTGLGRDVDVFRATRTSKDDPFENVTPMAELNTTYFEQPLTITPDGCRLYMSSNRNAQGGSPTSIDVYVATRGF